MKKSRRGGPGRIRVLGGHLRGSLLPVPDRPGVRPTPGRVRETLFNWLAPHISGARCLDLFAGSGALGVEALSRGAASACFVERDASLARTLREQLARLQQTDVEVHCADASAWLQQTPARAHDIVFVDPPFALDLWTRVAEALEAAPWLAPMAWIHVEMPSAGHPGVPSTWQVHRQGRAGDVRHVLYRRDASFR